MLIAVSDCCDAKLNGIYCSNCGKNIRTGWGYDLIHYIQEEVLPVISLLPDNIRKRINE